MPGDTTRYSWPYQTLNDPPDGPVLGQDLAAAVESTVGAIDDRLALVEADGSAALGVVYRHNRTSTAGPLAGTAGLVVCRINNMALRAGRAYEVRVGNIRPTQTADGGMKVDLRYNAAGAATVSSTEIGRSETNLAGLTGDNLPSPTGWIYPATNTVAASVVLTMTRFSGTGTMSLPPDAGGLWLHVIDHGEAPADTGADA